MTEPPQTPNVPSSSLEAPAWLHIARREVGVREIVGQPAHPRILEYFSVTSLASHPLAQSDETAWCSAFACWVMESAGIKSPRSASARAWLKWGVPLDVPRRGCVVVFWRGTPRSSAGHVAFYDQSAPPAGHRIMVLGGNQAPGSGSVCTAPYPMARVLGYRWPATTPPPR